MWKYFDTDYIYICYSSRYMLRIFFAALSCYMSNGEIYSNITAYLYAFKAENCAYKGMNLTFEMQDQTYPHVNNHCGFNTVNGRADTKKGDPKITLYYFFTSAMQSDSAGITAKLSLREVLSHYFMSIILRVSTLSPLFRR